MGDSPTIRGFTENANVVCVNEDNPAPKAGTVTSVSIYSPAPVGSGVTLFTASRAGTTLTIRAAVDVTTTATNAVNTFATSLPVQAGDFIGARSAANIMVRSDISGGASSSVASATKPAPGVTYTVTTAARIYSIQGTGS